jgi:ubiquitin C-terminal hydrolase
VVKRCTSQPNAGLKNSGKLCYSNAIFQAFKSCNHRTTLFDDPPQQNHERIPLCYKFAKVLHLMVNNQLSDQDVVDPSDLIDLFLGLHSDFVDRECEYC